MDRFMGPRRVPSNDLEIVQTASRLVQCSLRSCCWEGADPGSYKTSFVLPGGSPPGPYPGLFATKC